MDDGAGGPLAEVVGLSSDYNLNSYLESSGVVSGATY